jgi:hypothetical protein
MFQTIHGHMIEIQSAWTDMQSLGSAHLVGLLAQKASEKLHSVQSNQNRRHFNGSYSKIY